MSNVQILLLVIFLRASWLDAVLAVLRRAAKGLALFLCYPLVRMKVTLQADVSHNAFSTDRHNIAKTMCKIPTRVRDIHV